MLSFSARLRMSHIDYIQSIVNRTHSNWSGFYSPCSKTAYFIESFCLPSGKFHFQPFHKDPLFSPQFSIITIIKYIYINFQIIFGLFRFIHKFNQNSHVFCRHFITSNSLFFFEFCSRIEELRGAWIYLAESRLFV